MVRGKGFSSVFPHDTQILHCKNKKETHFKWLLVPIWNCSSFLFLFQNIQLLAPVHTNTTVFKILLLQDKDSFNVPSCGSKASTHQAHLKPVSCCSSFNTCHVMVGVCTVFSNESLDFLQSPAVEKTWTATVKGHCYWPLKTFVKPPCKVKFVLFFHVHTNMPLCGENRVWTSTAF